VRVPVVDVRVVRVRVHDSVVDVPVRVRLRGLRGGLVLVPVVLVVRVGVVMGERHVRVLVQVPLGQVEPQGGADAPRQSRHASFSLLASSPSGLCW
jgi:hypothetical protein